MRKSTVCFLLTLVLLLSGCGAEEKAYTHGIYRFAFSVYGGNTRDWDFVYTYQGEQITSGHRILYSLELFTFYRVQVAVMEKADPSNIYTAEFPVAICDGGSGKT